MGNIANYLKAKAGGMADVSAALVSALFDQGADVHVTLPNYRAMFNHYLPPVIKKYINTFRRIMPDERIHLAWIFTKRCWHAPSSRRAQLVLDVARP